MVLSRACVQEPQHATKRERRERKRKKRVQNAGSPGAPLPLPRPLSSLCVLSSLSVHVTLCVFLLCVARMTARRRLYFFFYALWWSSPLSLSSLSPLRAVYIPFCFAFRKAGSAIHSNATLERRRVNILTCQEYSECDVSPHAVQVRAMHAPFVLARVSLKPRCLAGGCGSTTPTRTTRTH